MLRRISHQVRNVTETTSSTPVAEDRQRFIVQRLTDKRRHNTTVAQPHPRTIRIEDEYKAGIEVPLSAALNGHIADAAGEQRMSYLIAQTQLVPTLHFFPITRRKPRSLKN